MHAVLPPGFKLKLALQTGDAKVYLLISPDGRGRSVVLSNAQLAGSSDHGELLQRAVDRTVERMKA